MKNQESIVTDMTTECLKIKDEVLKTKCICFLTDIFNIYMERHPDADDDWVWFVIINGIV